MQLWWCYIWQVNHDLRSVLLDSFSSYSLGAIAEFLFKLYSNNVQLSTSLHISSITRRESEWQSCSLGA